MHPSRPCLLRTSWSSPASISLQHLHVSFGYEWVHQLASGESHVVGYMMGQCHRMYEYAIAIEYQWALPTVTRKTIQRFVGDTIGSESLNHASSITC